MIGTPGGVNGTRARAIAGTEERGRHRAAAVQLHDEQRQEESRERGVQAECRRIAERLAADDARRSCPRPSASHRTMPAPISRLGSNWPLALRRDRPRLVDDELRLEEPTQRPAAEEACDAHADRQVARVEQQRGQNRGVSGPPPAETTDAAANCAEPAKVIALMTIAGARPMPPDVADRTPNETPNRPTAIGQRNRRDRAPTQLEADRRGLFHEAMLAAARAGAGFSPVRRRTA